VRSALNLPAHLELDAGLRYVDALPNMNIGSYLAADVRLGWRPSKRVEFAIVFQNLFDPRHPEFRSSFLPLNSAEVERSVYGQFTLRL
jgi:iron complex outermembrane receptor protein